MLYGPCLHALPGLGHETVAGATAKGRHSGDPAQQAPHGSSDHCLVCQFLAQGQLTTEPARESSTQRVTSLGPLPLPALVPFVARGPSHPRAPPLRALNVA
jgi:hypothetical protein